MSDSKFRSIDAFRQFEQKRPSRAEGGSSRQSEGRSLSPLTVFAAIKKTAVGATRSDLVRELRSDPTTVDAAVLRLLKEELVVLRRDGEGGEERIVAV